MCNAMGTVHRVTRKEQHTPHAKVFAVEMARRGISDYDERSVDNIYHCTLCRRCTEFCVTHQELWDIIETARADIVNSGKAPQSVLQGDKNLEEVKNPFGYAFEEWFANLDLSKSKEEKDAEVLLFVGCTAAYKRPEIANAILKIFDVAGVNYAVMNGEEWCCGRSAYNLGLRDRARKLAKHNAKAIEATGIKTIVTICPDCTKALKFDYKKWGISLDVEVLHYVEFINQLLNEKKLKVQKPLDKTVTYFDPCILGRHLRIFDIPRNLLKQIPRLNLVEMHWNKGEALCCGSGIFSLTHPETAVRLGQEVISEANRTNAELLITACPFCKENLSLSVQNLGKPEIKDIAEVIAMTL